MHSCSIRSAFLCGSKCNDKYGHRNRPLFGRPFPLKIKSDVFPLKICHSSNMVLCIFFGLCAVFCRKGPTSWGPSEVCRGVAHSGIPENLHRVYLSLHLHYPIADSGHNVLYSRNPSVEKDSPGQ